MAKCSQLTLAKCGIGQIRFGQMRPNKDGQIRFGQMRSRPKPCLDTRVNNVSLEKKLASAKERKRGGCLNKKNQNCICGRFRRSERTKFPVQLKKNWRTETDLGGIALGIRQQGPTPSPHPLISTSRSQSCLMLNLAKYSQRAVSTLVGCELRQRAR